MSAVASASRGRRAGARPAGGLRRRLRDRSCASCSAQLSTRLLAVIVVVAPFAFGVLLRVQSGTPSDALFGAYVHSSGFAISLVTLGFAGAWGFPIIAGLLAGDLFASEDRHGTWKTILTRSCTREDLFAGKLLAAGTVAIAISLLLAATSLIAGSALVGPHAVVNLSGVLTSPGRTLALALVSWLYCVLPMLAYTSLAILFSVATRNGILGVLGPLLVALVTQLLDLIGKGVVMHMILIGPAFDAWHGLFVSHPFLGPLLVSSLVCVAWIAACLTASWWILARRDFVARTDAARPNWRAPIRVVALATAIVALLALGAGLGPTGVTADRLSAAIGPAFNHITLLQQAMIGRQAPPCAQARCAAQLQLPVGRRWPSIGQAIGSPHPLRLPAQGQRRPVPADPGRLRGQRAVQRLLQGPVAAVVPRRPDHARRRRPQRGQPTVHRLRLLQHPVTTG